MKNYVIYSGQLWEVVETSDSNNTIKLVSASSLTSIAYGSTNDWKSSWVRKWLNEYFYNKLERTDIIKETEFCIDNIDVNPENYTKMNSCTNKVSEKVGLLTYEDYIYAKDGETIQNGNSFLDEDELSWTITPTTENATYIWHTNYSNPSKIIKEDYSSKTNGQGVRPVISIDDSVLVKAGTGTKKDPYILSSERSLSKGKRLNLGKVGEYVYMDESKNPYVREINETYINKVTNKTSTSKVRYRIVDINEDGSVKVERADILRNLPDMVSTGSGVYIPFYSYDSGEGSTSCLYDPNRKYGEEDLNNDSSGVNGKGNYYLKGCAGHNIYNSKEEGNIGYYLNNASNSFYNWYSNIAKKMIIKTQFNLNTGGYGKDYSNLNNGTSTTYPQKTNDGIEETYVGLPSWGEMYTGNDLNISYWYINRWASSSSIVSFVYNGGSAPGYYAANPWYAARPVITLTSNVYVKEGEGTASNPYTLGI